MVGRPVAGTKIWEQTEKGTDRVALERWCGAVIILTCLGAPLNLKKQQFLVVWVYSPILRKYRLYF